LPMLGKVASRSSIVKPVVLRSLHKVQAQQGNARLVIIRHPL